MKTLSKSLVLLFLGVSLNACAFPSYTTKQGIGIYDNTAPDVVVSQESVNEILDAFTKEFKLPKYVISTARFHFYSKLIQIPHGDEAIIADGYTDPLTGDILISIFTPCLGDSSMIHELAHFFFRDRDHKQKVIWSKVEALENRFKQTCTSEQLAIDKEKRNPANGNSG